MTEKQGGSDVRQNTTTARPLSNDMNVGSPFLLTGHVADRVGPQLLKIVEEWASELNGDVTDEILRAKLEEIVWMNAVIYGVCGWAGRKQVDESPGQFNADFFL